MIRGFSIESASSPNPDPRIIAKSIGLSYNDKIKSEAS